MSRRRALVSALWGVLLLTGLPVRAADPTPAPAWTAAAVASAPGQPAGYTQYQKMCAICHGAGPGKPGTRALSAKYQGKLPALLEERKDLSAEFVKFTVRHGVSVMPPVRKTELSDADLEAIAAYLARKKR
jgi:mono/diheme cytochrome c family protein